jgi:hypothetical protein
MVAVSPEELKQALTGERIVLGGRSSSHRVVMAVVGVWTAGGAFMAFVLSGSGGYETNDTFLALMIAAGAALACLMGGGGWTCRFTLDTSARTYVWEYGLYSFIERRQGGMDEFDCLSLARRTGPGRHGGTYSCWVLCLARKAGPSALPGKKPAASPAVLVSGAQDQGDRAELVSLAEALARKSALPFQDESQ